MEVIDSWLTNDWRVIDKWLTVNQQLAKLGKLLANSWLSFGGLSTGCWPTDFLGSCSFILLYLQVIIVEQKLEE